jgi:mRNA-degrading endonuclease RelE of RelBE toxin-antitoxin system
LKLAQTTEFEKDVKKLDKSKKERLRKAIQKICSNPEFGKPLKHSTSTFSERILNYRLIYFYKKSENEILLVCFKNREGVYSYLAGT